MQVRCFKLKSLNTDLASRAARYALSKPMADKGVEAEPEEVLSCLSRNWNFPSRALA
jgi:hypothetical protein